MTPFGLGKSPLTVRSKILSALAVLMIRTLWTGSTATGPVITLTLPLPAHQNRRASGLLRQLSQSLREGVQFG